MRQLCPIVLFVARSQIFEALLLSLGCLSRIATTKQLCCSPLRFLSMLPRTYPFCWDF